VDLDTVYRALWRWAEGPIKEIPLGPSGKVYRQPQVIVRYWLPQSAPHANTAGWFSARGFHGDQPHLGIIRERVPGTGREPDPRSGDELFTLAHEGGHAESWRRGERPAGSYEQDVDRPPTDWQSFPEEAKRTILDEEARAWRYGREALAREGFDDWAAFDAAESAGLARYRLFLWPKSVATG
jgi:hypothetical protein